MLCCGKRRSIRSRFPQLCRIVQSFFFAIKTWRWWRWRRGEKGTCFGFYSSFCSPSRDKLDFCRANSTVILVQRLSCDVIDRSACCFVIDIRLIKTSHDVHYSLLGCAMDSTSMRYHRNNSDAYLACTMTSGGQPMDRLLFSPFLHRCGSNSPTSRSEGWRLSWPGRDWGHTKSVPPPVSGKSRKWDNSPHAPSTWVNARIWRDLGAIPIHFIHLIHI